MLLFQQFVVGSEADKLGLSVLPDSTVTTDSIQVPLPDSTSIRIDSLNADTSQESDEVIKSKIKYHAKDSIRVNLENEIVYLYGEATVDYEDLHLEADRIVIDMQNKELFAEGTKDSTVCLKGRQTFLKLNRSSGQIQFGIIFRRKKVG
ncbi:MAG TPA: hypothetical protein PLZ91_03970 [Bacteroidia bacterium]|nr:hypothetical protein [Bacteroidia bacterium]